MNTVESSKDVSSIARFSPPPMCMSDDRNMPKIGDVVMVINEKGEKIRGTLHDTDLNQKYLRLNTNDGNAPLDVDYEKIKLIHLPEFRKWINLPDNSPVIVSDEPCSELDFSVIFKDGDKLKGKTLGFNTDRSGIYLFPTQKPGYFSYIFIPHQFVKQQQIGPKIGEQLLEDDAVTEESLNSAIDEQTESRKQQLGEYLKNRAIVTTNELERALDSQSNRPNIKLGEVLLEENLINEEQLELALQEQQRDRSVPLGEILVNQGEISKEQLQKSLSNKMGIPFVDAAKIDVDAHVVAALPENIARQYCVLPVAFFNNKMIVVVENPLDWNVLESIRFAVKSDVIPVMAFADDIREAIDVHYTMYEFDDEPLEEGEDEEYSLDESAVSDNVIVRLANKIIIDAYNKKASDIHIEPYPGQQKTHVRLRKDGALISYHAVSPKLRYALIARYKIMAGLDVTERRKPQDGKINFGRFSRLKIEVRIATIPTAGNEEDIVMRILAGSSTVALEDMKLDEDNINCIKHVLESPYGLFFVCGPTGSGKTTLLHALLRHLNTPDRKIWTAEDPVEITQKGLRQVQVNPGAGLDFAASLRSFLRGDPDVIMVGEMRDEETTKMGIEASLTGHLVLSTLHTNGAAESIVRLLEMGMDPYNFSDALLGIVAQRLTRKLCDACKRQIVIDENSLDGMLSEYCAELVKSGVEEITESGRQDLLGNWQTRFADNAEQFIMYKADGCKSCEQTGYNGRIALQEMLMASPDIRVAIYRRASATDLLKIALLEGMTSLKQDGIRKILQGYTDMQQVRKVCAV